MALIHHVVKGGGNPPFVLVHGFACDHTDYDAQVADLSARHKTVAVDLRGHGLSKAAPDECSIERFGADVAEVMHALDLPPAILVGHSMGCRVVLETALQAPARTAGLILIDGSQFSPTMEPVLKERFASEGFDGVVNGTFADMFTAKSNCARAEAVVARARKLPAAIGSKVLLDLLRYDVTRLDRTLDTIRWPLMAVQTTFSNEKRQRSTMEQGQTTPYLDMVRGKVPNARIEIIPDTGHFPQIDEPAATTALLAEFARKFF